MSQGLYLNGADAKIALLVLAYEQQSPTNADDANWLRCQASISIGAWQASFFFTCLTNDLVKLAVDLQALDLGGVARFAPLEKELELAFELCASGVLVTGSSLYKTSNKGFLSSDIRFSFSSSQRVEDLLEAVTGLTALFPLINFLD